MISFNEQELEKEIDVAEEKINKMLNSGMDFAEVLKIIDIEEKIKAKANMKGSQ
jgi:hypothetical protein